MALHRSPPWTCSGRGRDGVRTEDIGYLTTPVRLDEWIATVRTRYAFLAALDPDEQRWAACNARHLHEVTTALAALDAPSE